MKTKIRIILIAAAALVFGASIFSVSSAQKGFSETSSLYLGSDQNIENRPEPALKLGPFSHRTRAHREGKYASCESCHAMPTGNWATARKNPYPDVKDYPYHTSCYGCHTKEIYTAGSGFCGTCHTVDGPQARGRVDVRPFPMKSHSMQFTTIFPHDVHQNLIAQNTARPEVAIGHFVFASFAATAVPTPTPAAGCPTPTPPPAPTPTPASQFYNCAICHKTMTQMPKYAARTITNEKSLGAAEKDVFIDPPPPLKPCEKPDPDPKTPDRPTAGFFKDGPDSHASCFTCHYQRVKPAAYDCAGCHKLADAPYFEKKGVERYSIKFDHSYTNHVSDCTVCHVRITQNSDVSKMKDADVPFQTCSTSSCHGGNIEEEIKKREASIAAKQPAFQCVKCHTTAVGRYDIPASHRKY